MLGKVVDDKNLLINIGSNIIVQKTMEESNQLVDEQIRELDKLQDSLRKELERFM
jgi:prefoldin subunit 5